jgi:protein-S-isoprenylcysteine O-methyltransferase Ste14
MEKYESASNKDRTKKKSASVAVVTILALFGIYLMSLQVDNGSTGYATCLDNGNVLIGGITLIVLILLFVLISTRKMGKEVIRYVPVKTKSKSRRRK